MQRLRTAFLPIFLIVLVSNCSRDNQDSSHLSNSFGPRKKEAILVPTEYPYSTIGRIGDGCVATLIGRSIAVTAGHCVVDENTGLVDKDFNYFIPNATPGTPEAEPVFVDSYWLGSRKPSENRALDWAIVHLSKPVGDRLKWLLVDGTDIKKQLPYTVNLMGYSEDYVHGTQPYLFSDCMILQTYPKQQQKPSAPDAPIPNPPGGNLSDKTPVKQEPAKPTPPKVDVNAGNLYHNCHTGLGTSGAPMYFPRESGTYLDAIHLSEKRKHSPVPLHKDKYSFEYANLAISAKEFVETFSVLRQTIDQDSKAVVPEIPGVIAGKIEKATTVAGGQPNQANVDLMLSPLRDYLPSQVLAQRSGTLINANNDIARTLAAFGQRADVRSNKDLVQATLRPFEDAKNLNIHLHNLRAVGLGQQGILADHISGTFIALKKNYHALIGAATQGNSTLSPSQTESLVQVRAAIEKFNDLISRR